MFVNTTSADESLVQIHAEIVRKGRETPSISGTLDCQYPLDETTLVEAVVYRSQTGSEDDYKLTPWGIPRKTFTEYMREYYNNMIYPNFEGCSNLAKPGTENAWSKVNYVFDECIPTGKGLPEIVPEGYYKIQFTATGRVEWGFVFVMRIVSKSNMMGY